MALTVLSSDYVADLGPGYNTGGSITSVKSGYALLFDQAYDPAVSTWSSRARVVDMTGDSWDIGDDVLFDRTGPAVRRTPTATSDGNMVVMTGLDGRGYRLLAIDTIYGVVTVGNRVDVPGGGTTLNGQRGARLGSGNDMMFVRRTADGVYAEAVRVSNGALTVLGTLSLPLSGQVTGGHGTVIALDATSALAALSLSDGKMRVYRIALADDGTLSQTHIDVTATYQPYPELYASISGYAAEIILPDGFGGYIRRGITYSSGALTVTTLTLGAIDSTARPPGTSSSGTSLVMADDRPAAYMPTGTSLLVARNVIIGGVTTAGRALVVEYAATGDITGYTWDESGRAALGDPGHDIQGIYDDSLSQAYVTYTDAYAAGYVNDPTGKGPFLLPQASFAAPAPPYQSGVGDLTITVTSQAAYGQAGSGATFEVQGDLTPNAPGDEWLLVDNLDAYAVYGAGSGTAAAVSSTRSSGTFVVDPGAGANLHHIEWWAVDQSSTSPLYLGTYTPGGFPDGEATRPPFDHAMGQAFTLFDSPVTLSNLRIQNGTLWFDYDVSIPANRYVRVYLGHWYAWVKTAYNPPATAGNPQAPASGGLTGSFVDLVGSGSGTTEVSVGPGLYLGDTVVDNYYVSVLMRTSGENNLSTIQSVGVPFTPKLLASGTATRLLDLGVPPTIKFNLSDGGYTRRTHFV